MLGSGRRSGYLWEPMSRTRHLSLSLLLLAAGPFASLACGEGKPPETPADEASSEAPSSGAAPAESSSADMAGGDESAPAASAAPAAASAAPAAPPPAPALGNSDCGKCIDTACAKPAAACSKDDACKSMLDGFHACTGTAGSCVEGASMPSKAKPKKLATAYGKCAKKAIGSKACKTKCP